MNYYQFHISDWALHTSHLTLEEEAVYHRLLGFYYDTESPIPEETQSVIRRLRLGSHAQIVADILQEFFTLEDGFWHSKRADREIAAYHAKSEIAKENGKKGGRPKSAKPKDEEKQEDSENENPEETQSVNLANPEITESKANQEPLTINQEPRTKNDKPKDKSKNTPNKSAPFGLGELLDLDVDQQIALDYLAVRKAGKKLFSKTVLNGLVKASEKAGMSMNEMLTICAEKGWLTFDISWTNKSPANNRPSNLSIADQSKSALEDYYAKKPAEFDGEFTHV